MGRRPEGEEALSGAERQARYRQRLELALEQPSDQTRRHAPTPGRSGRGEGDAPAAPRKPPRGPSLLQRWDDMVAGLVGTRAQYVRWFEAMPEATRDTATGEALQAMVDLDLEEIMAIRPPRGFGRD